MYAATAIRGLGINSVQGYLQQLRETRQRLAMRAGESLRDAIEAQLLWKVQQGHTESNGKKLVLGLRLLEKFCCLPSTVTAADWLFIDAFQRVPMQKQEGRTKQWAAMDCIRQLCIAARSDEQWEIVALAALSVAFGLRGSEAFTAAPDVETLHFKGTKGRGGMRHESLGPWARKWADFLARLRALRGQHPHRPAFVTSKAHLEMSFALLLQTDGCRCHTIRWHSWRRFGAAQLHCLKLSLHLIQIWGGWKSLAVARMYATLPPSWEFKRDGPMPAPKWSGRQAGWYELDWPSTAIFSHWMCSEIASQSSDSGLVGRVASSQAPKRQR
jgi:hypothetical protein|mmetsp:Transcript_15719/g.27682  ORF Transcript_15719/g.27682 Transcript_15719/m.27682 type:complete len:328 (+) Transcript_15719:1238-2221(+)